MSDSDSDYRAEAREFVRRVMKHLRLDATNTARRAGLNPSTLTRILSDQANVPAARRSTLQALSRISGLPVPAAAARAAVSASPVPGDGYFATRDVPLYALLPAPADGAFYWNQTVVDYAPRLPGIARAARVFALHMPDATMAGWRRVGELVYVDPVRPIGDGDHVFIELANRAAPNNPGLHMIRRLLLRTANEIRLGAWDCVTEDHALRSRDVVSIFRVIEWAELAGA